MAFEFDLNKVKESLVNAGKEVESMAKDASAVAKIKIDIHNKEVFLEKQFALLGKAFYEAHKDEDIYKHIKRGTIFAFANMKQTDFDKMFASADNSKRVLLDIKGLLDRDEYEEAGYNYWRL